MAKLISLLVGLGMAYSVHAESGLGAYVAARTNYSGLGAIRLTYGAYEAGMFAPGSYGVNKRFKIGSNYYAVLGAGLMAPLAPALLTGAGFNFFKVFNFGLRGELYTMTGTHGMIRGAGLLGLSWNY